MLRFNIIVLERKRKRKTYCSVTKKCTVILCWCFQLIVEGPNMTLQSNPHLIKNRRRYDHAHFYISRGGSCRASRRSKGWSMQQLKHDVALFCFVCLLCLLHSLGKMPKYDCKCKLYERKMREAYLRSGSLSNHLSRLGFGNSAKSPQIWWIKGEGGINEPIRTHSTYKCSHSF